jgi:hypothetical protein
LKTVVDKIEALTSERGYIYTLALILLRDLFMTPEDIADINPREHLNFQEITFLVGLLVKNPIDLSLPAEPDSEKRFEETYRLFYELHKKYHEPFIEQLCHIAEHGRGTETRQ